MFIWAPHLWKLPYTVEEGLGFPENEDYLYFGVYLYLGPIWKPTYRVDKYSIAMYR